MAKTAAALIALLIAVVPAAAQTQSLRLRVVGDPDSVPLPRSRVSVAAAGRTALPVLTDDDGRVELTGVPGAAELRVSKSGYAPATIRLAPRAAAPSEIRLVPAAVITGRVVDSSGQPAVRVAVRVRRVQASATPANVPTDDRGEFRVGQLASGQYELFTQGRGGEPMSDTVSVTLQAGEQIDIALTQLTPSVEFPFSEGGAVSGTVVDEYGEPMEGLRVALLALGTTGVGHISPPAVTVDRGRYRLYFVPPERYLLAVSGDAGPVDEPDTRATVRLGLGDTSTSPYLPVYYPGRLNPAEAVPLVVQRGIELNGMDLVAPSVRGVRVHGIVGPAGGPDPVQVFLRPAAGWTAGVIGPRSAIAGADGRFELRNVPPGEYTLQTLSPVVYDRPSTTTEFRFGAIPMTIGNEDVGPVTLTASSTSTIRGHITLEGGDERVSPADFFLAVLPVDRTASPEPQMTRGAIAIAPPAEPDDRWRFRISALAGLNRFGLARAPQGWWLKSVGIGGVNAAVDPADFGSTASSRDDVEIVLSRNGATITGRATAGSNGQPPDTYTVIAFPTDRDLWFADSPRVKTTTSRSDGGFIVSSLAPGDYLVAAVEFSEIDPNAEELLQADALAGLATTAERVTVGEGEQRRLELRLTPTPR
jgi:hypothetical protein